jgi:L-serine dehydratase
MEDLSIFDIAGPVMVGPSSSHTAGACKIGQFARALFHGTPSKATFYLHGSFAEVYKGHATDKALLGGVLKFQTNDSRIKKSFEIAKSKKLNYVFFKKNLGPKYHPNTVRIVLQNSRRKMSIIGSSIGGGRIEIVKLNNFDINLKGRAGKYLSLVVCHKKRKEIIEEIKLKLRKLGIKIAEIAESSYNGKSVSVISLDGKPITLPQVIGIEKSTKGVEFIRSLSKLQTQ